MTNGKTNFTWTKSEVINIFYNQETICYSKGFKLFEEVYEELKDILDLIRIERDNFVIIKKK